MFFVAILSVVLMTALFFNAFLQRRITQAVLRIIVALFLAVASWGGLVWGSIALFFNNMYPTSTHSINDEYSYTQQPYGFVTTSSQGYNLVFYKNRAFWFDQELGKIQLECSGNESIASNISTINNENRLVIKVDSVVAVDTTLSFTTPFFFNRTYALEIQEPPSSAGNSVSVRSKKHLHFRQIIDYHALDF